MPGIFSTRNRPRRPGAYFNWVATQDATVLPSAAGVTALIFTADWGPLEVPTLLQDFQHYLDVFGDSTDTEAYMAAWGAFVGEGIPGRGGSGAVLAYRVGSAAAAKATLTLSNTAAAGALRIDARYHGSRGNDLSVDILPVVNGQRTFVLYDGTTELERWSFNDTSMADVATQLNSYSDWVTGTVLADGIALADIAATPMAGGNDGATLIDGDLVAAYTALGGQSFGLLAFARTLSSAVQTSFAAFVATQNQRGRRFMAVVGGDAGELLAVANTRSRAYNNSDVVNLGGATFNDDTLGVLSTAQMAPRVAGILAQRGELKSLTFGRLSGVELTYTGAVDDTTVEAAFDAGTTVFTSDSHPTAPVRIEKGLTTYTGGDGAKPVDIYSVPKYVRTMHGIETELTAWAEQNVIGELPVNEQTRGYVVGETLARLNARASNGILQPGPTVSTTPASTDDVEFVELQYGIRFGRSVEQVFNIVKIG